MKNQIPKFLQEKLSKTYALTKNFPDEIKQFLIDYAKFYEWKISNIQTIFRLLQQNISELNECEYAGCNNKQKVYENGKISRGCCKKHTSIISNLETKGVEWFGQLEETKEKKAKTNLKKYGVDNPMKNKEIVKKGKQTKKERYGTENYNNIEKMQSTMVERYNVKNPAYLTTTQLKRKKTCLAKYGSVNPLESDEIKNKILKTNLEKYDVDNPLKNSSVKNKSMETIFKKYGVLYPAQNPIILDKITKSSYKYVDYEWMTGEITKLQGYEPIVLKELEEKGYLYSEIKSDKCDMPEIWYVFEGTNHRYYPDFYIPHENLVIEVKSEWTLNLHKEKNQAKFQAVKDAGFNFQLEVR